MSHFQSTAATETRCPRCHRAILTALDDGLRARVDTTPLTDPLAEVTALLENRRTYTRTQFGHLIERNADRIAAGTLRGAIHAEHKCTGPQQLALIGD